MASDRYSRQRRLAEVGEMGQLLLEQATVQVHGSDACGIETAYLRRAGVKTEISASARASEGFVHSEHFRHPAALTLAAGAWGALRHMRRILKLEEK